MANTTEDMNDSAATGDPELDAQKLPYNFGRILSRFPTFRLQGHEFKNRSTH